MSNTLEIWTWTVGIAAMIPFVVYLSIKLGTYAFYRGRDIFIQEKKDEHDEQ